MDKQSDERVAIFIDGSNFYHSTKKILKMKERINYQKLIDVLTGNRRLVNAFYYVAPLDISADLQKFKKHKKFLGAINKISKFNVVLCTLKKLKIDGSYVYLIKGDDVRLSHDILMGAVKDLYDTAIIVSGDEDFFPLIKTVKEYGKKVENAYIRSSSSYKLRRACDSSLNISKIASRIIDKTEFKKSSSALRRQH